MKVIFLNFNGVLNTKHWFEKTCLIVNPRFMRNLKKIVRRTDAKIVLFSSNRYVARENSYHWQRKIFKEYGLDIYDYTPYTGMEKGIDVQEWLNHHLDVTNIAILSDGSDMCHLMEYLVKTENDSCSTIFGRFLKEGLCGKKTREAIHILHKPYENKMKQQVIGNTRKRF